MNIYIILEWTNKITIGGIKVIRQFSRKNKCQCERIGIIKKLIILETWIIDIRENQIIWYKKKWYLRKGILIRKRKIIFRKWKKKITKFIRWSEQKRITIFSINWWRKEILIQWETIIIGHQRIIKKFRIGNKEKIGIREFIIIKIKVIIFIY